LKSSIIYGNKKEQRNQRVDNVENLLLKLKERIIGSFISEVTAFLENSPKCQFYKHMYSIRIFIAIKTESLISINVIESSCFCV
jgi:protein-disulfide isomerase